MSKMRFFALQELANRRPVPVDYPSEKLSDYYGAHVFDRKKMQEFLPREAYKEVIKKIKKGLDTQKQLCYNNGSSVAEQSKQISRKIWVWRSW